MRWIRRSSKGLPLRKSEVVEIIRSDEGEKAPGPDGFNMISYKHYWTAVKEKYYGCGELFVSEWKY